MKHTAPHQGNITHTHLNHACFSRPEVGYVMSWAYCTSHQTLLYLPSLSVFFVIARTTFRTEVRYGKCRSQSALNKFQSILFPFKPAPSEIQPVLGPFRAVSAQFSLYDMSVQTSAWSALPVCIAFSVFNTSKTGFWVCCSPIGYKYDQILTRFHFDWGTSWVNMPKMGRSKKQKGQCRGAKKRSLWPVPHPACYNSLHSPQLFLFLLFTLFSDLFILLLCVQHNL